MLTQLPKLMLPNRSMPLPILGGPFRGARISLNPRYSLRKVFGIYEHELNSWLQSVLPCVNTVLDVGANDGYFTFGCAAAFERRRKSAEIFAFEPLKQHFKELEASLKNHSDKFVNITLNNSFVGSEARLDTTTLDITAQKFNDSILERNALIKIDVEGAELEVIKGAKTWLNSRNFFLIEVHHESFLEILTRKFGEHSIQLKQINQKPLPIIGREMRSELNWWLVSERPC